MNTSQLTTTEALAGWISNVHALAADLARPIETMSDPRMLELVRSMPKFEKWGIEFAPKELGETYFTHVGRGLLPEPPIARPAWAESHTYYMDDYPNTISVEFEGKKWDTGGSDPEADGPEAYAQLSQTFHIALVDFGEDVTDPYTHEKVGVQRVAGEVWGDVLTVEFSYLEPMGFGFAPRKTLGRVTVDGARALEIALGDALSAVPFGAEAVNA